MATSFAIENGPELTPEIKGNKVVFTRKVDEPKAEQKPQDAPPVAPDANTTPEPPADKPRERNRGSQQS